jgi:hypothetical protein
MVRKEELETRLKNLLLQQDQYMRSSKDLEKKMREFEKGSDSYNDLQLALEGIKQALLLLQRDIFLTTRELEKRKKAKK